MTYAGPMRRVPPLYLSSFSRYGHGLMVAGYAGTAPANNTWGTNNLGLYIPFEVDHPVVLDKLYWVCGNTSVANADLGIFSDAWAKLVSTGSVAMQGAAGRQETNITDYLLVPGKYYWGLSASLSTAGFISAALALMRMQHMGCLTEASAVPLPATATPVALTANPTNLPLIGAVTKWP